MQAIRKGQTPQKNVVVTRVDPATSATPRSALVFVGNAVYSVTQDGDPCKTTVVSPAKQAEDASGGDNQIAVTAAERTRA